MAIACLRLVTFLPLRPLLSLPSFMARISRSTSLLAAGLYLRDVAFFAVFFAAVFLLAAFFVDFLATFLVAIRFSLYLRGPRDVRSCIA